MLSAFPRFSRAFPCFVHRVEWRENRDVLTSRTQTSWASEVSPAARSRAVRALISDESHVTSVYCHVSLTRDLCSVQNRTWVPEHALLLYVISLLFYDIFFCTFYCQCGTGTCRRPKKRHGPSFGADMSRFLTIT